MPFDAEKEITKLWKDLGSAQSEIGKTYMRWRRAALEIAGPDADPTEVSLKAARIIGVEFGRSLLPRLNWLKGEEAWLMSLAGQLAGQWMTHGAQVKIEKGDKPFEVLIKWERCPWPTFAKEYDVPMEEDVRCCDAILQTSLTDINVFFNVEYHIETLKAIPRGQGVCLRRLAKAIK